MCVGGAGNNNGFQYLLVLGQGPAVGHGVTSQAEEVVWGTDQGLGRREHAAPSDSLGWSPLSTLGNWQGQCRERITYSESLGLGPDKPLRVQMWSSDLTGWWR